MIASYLWAGGLDSSKIYVFDVGTDPSKPTAGQDDHRFASAYRLCRATHLLRAAGPDADRQHVEPRRERRCDGHGALQQQGRVRGEVPDARGKLGGVQGDGYGYDIAINPAGTPS